MRIGASNSKFNIESTKVIHKILTFSPAPDAVAVEFLNELEKVKGITSLVAPVRCRVSRLDSLTWAAAIIYLLSSKLTKEQGLQALEPLSNLATEMLTHLLIASKAFLYQFGSCLQLAGAARNPGGKKTPQDTAHSTPDTYHSCEMQNLLENSVTKRSQSALKQLLLRRDGFICPFTGNPFKPPRRVVPRASHILPFSFGDKPLTLRALEIFTGRLLADQVHNMINHPCNAFNAESNAHESYDNLAWGIEAVNEDNQVNIILEQGSRELTLPQWKYYFREIRPDEISSTITLREGQEIIFGLGNPDGEVIDRPNPEYCNIKLALARAVHACGVADIIAEMDWDIDDDEAIVNLPVYFGGPFIPDDILFQSLSLLLTQSVLVQATSRSTGEFSQFASANTSDMFPGKSGSCLESRLLENVPVRSRRFRNSLKWSLESEICGSQLNLFYMTVLETPPSQHPHYNFLGIEKGVNHSASDISVTSDLYPPLNALLPLNRRRRKLYIRVTTFIVLEIIFLIFAYYTLLHPIPLQNDTKDELTLLSSLTVTLTEFKAGITAVAVVWHTIACFFVKDVIAAVCSAEFMAQYRRSGTLEPGKSDRVSTVTSSIFDNIFHFLGRSASWEFRLGFMITLVLMTVGPLGSGTITVGSIPTSLVKPISIANVTGLPPSYPASAQAYHDMVAKANAILRLEGLGNTLFGYNMSTGDDASDSVLVPWPSMDIRKIIKVRQRVIKGVERYRTVSEL
ncbi:hypothetical protein NP233_g4960 [Leucocoprinus birnbaumii]|uniref:HNH nuclease domain-containing protein n=1 Tax=Leucocoprinus birnbaumii TaxID=56174 RepID=A0AAD5W056_9AGAR|nr:hypothetical protein NP233_g4960 [Leucocoprinus birnbaumii]